MNELTNLIEELITNTQIAKGILQSDTIKKSDAYANVATIGNEIVKCDEFKSQYTMIDVDCGYTNGGGWVNFDASNKFDEVITTMYDIMGWKLNNEKYCAVYVSPDNTEFIYNHGMELTGYMTEETTHQIVTILKAINFLGNRFENGVRIPDIKNNFGESFYNHLQF